MAALAAAEFELDLGRSYVVGDQPRDMELAAKIGARGLRIDPQRTSKRSESGIVEVRDLWEAAQWIVRDLRENKS
jgi:histidinol phosphatase-like enzyme